MERLWSPAVATGGNRWQIERPRKRLKQAKTVADGCDQLPGPQNGKEGVDGSSPSEGFREVPASKSFSFPSKATFQPGGVHNTSTAPNLGGSTAALSLSPRGFPLPRPTSIWRPRGGVACVGVEKRDRVLSAVAGQVAVVLVDHREACAHESGEIEDRDPRAEREGRIGMAEIIGSTDRVDPGGDLRRPPLAGTEVV
jgi:hypothetical protein